MSPGEMQFANADRDGVGGCNFLNYDPEPNHAMTANALANITKTLHRDAVKSLRSLEILPMAERTSEPEIFGRMLVTELIKPARDIEFMVPAWQACGQLYTQLVFPTNSPIVVAPGISRILFDQYGFDRVALVNALRGAIGSLEAHINNYLAAL